MVKLKLVGAGRFMHKSAHPIPVTRGQVITVTDKAVADHLLTLVNYDTLKNPHNIFEVYTGKDTPEGSVVKAPAKKRAPRKRAAKKVEVAPDMEVV